MDYTPVQPAPPQVTPTYELNTDATGKPPPVKQRGPFTLKDKNGQLINMPHDPNPKCNKCKGRGFIGNDIKTGRLIVCHKCYKK